MSSPGAPGRYRVAFAPAAARELGRLRADDAARLRRPILALAFDPRPIGALPVVGTSYLRIRVGHLRVISDVDDIARRVVVARVAKRAESTYRRLPTATRCWCDGNDRATGDPGAGAGSGPKPGGPGARTNPE